MKLPLIYTNVCLKQLLKVLLHNPTLNSNALHCSVVNSTSCWLHLLLIVTNTVCRIQNVTKRRVSCSKLYAVDHNEQTTRTVQLHDRVSALW